MTNIASSVRTDARAPNLIDALKWVDVVEDT